MPGGICFVWAPLFWDDHISHAIFFDGQKGEALVRVSRGDVQSVELERGKVLARLKLTFAEGVSWEFEVARANRKGAMEFTTALGGNVS